MSSSLNTKKRKSSCAEQKSQYHTKKGFIRLNEFRRDKIMCDFAIRVDATCIPVHRIVVAATSPYYKDVLVSQKNLNQSEDTIPNATLESVKHCVEFMYSGQTSVDIDEAENILYVASFMQLGDLIELWFKQFSNILNVRNCWDIKRLADKYDHKNKRSVDAFIYNNIEDVATHKDFLALSESEILKYIEKSQKLISVWKIFLLWINHDFSNRKDSLENIARKFTSTCSDIDTLALLLSEPLLIASNITYRLVAKSMVDKMSASQVPMTTRNLIALKKASSVLNDSKFSNEADKLTSINLQDISDKEDFLNLEFDDVKALLQLTKPNEASELSMWTAINRWAKYKTQRKKIYLKLLQAIQLSYFSKQFIKNVICKDSLVKEVNGCLDLAIESLITTPVLKKNSSKKKKKAQSNRLDLPVIPEHQLDRPSTSQKHRELPTTSVNLGVKVESMVQNMQRKNDQIKEQQESIRENLIMIINNNLKHVVGFCPENAKFYQFANISNKVKNCLSLPVTQSDFFQVVALEEKIYLLCQKSFSCLNGSSKRWSFPNPPTGNHDNESKAIVFQSNIFIIGHISEFYCPRNRAWKPFAMSDLLTIKFCLVSTPSKIYKIGGTLKNKATSWVTIWDSVQFTHNRMLETRKSASAASLGESVFVVGGVDQHDTILTTAECYNPLTDNWSMLENMCKVRSASVSCNFEDKIYVVGGGSIEEYDNKQRKWNIVTENDHVDDRLVAVGMTIKL